MVWNFSDTSNFNWISNFRKINMFVSEVVSDGASHLSEAPDGDSLQDALNYEHPIIYWISYYSSSMKIIKITNVDNFIQEKLSADLKFSLEERTSRTFITPYNSNMKNSNPIFNLKLYSKSFEQWSKQYLLKYWDSIISKTVIAVKKLKEAKL